MEGGASWPSLASHIGSGYLAERVYSTNLILTTYTILYNPIRIQLIHCIQLSQSYTDNDNDFQ